MDEHNTLLGEIDTLRGRHQRLLHEYNRKAMERMPSISSANIRMMAAIRQELGLKNDTEAFEAEMLASSKVLADKFLAMSEKWAQMMEDEA